MIFWLRTTVIIASSLASQHSADGFMAALVRRCKWLQKSKHFFKSTI